MNTGDGNGAVYNQRECPLNKLSHLSTNTHYAENDSGISFLMFWNQWSTGGKQLLLLTTRKMGIGLSKPDCRVYKGFGISYLTPVIGLIWVSHTPPTLTVFDTSPPWQVSPLSATRHLSSSGLPALIQEGVFR